MKWTITLMIYSEAKMERIDWLKARQKGIGGSEIGAILGIDHFNTPYTIYLSKIAETIEEDKPNKWMLAGREQEPVIAQRFADEYNFKVEVPDKEIYESPENPIFLGSVDRFYYDDKGEKCVLECKFTQKELIGDDELEEDDWDEDEDIAEF